MLLKYICEIFPSIPNFLTFEVLFRRYQWLHRLRSKDPNEAKTPPPLKTHVEIMLIQHFSPKTGKDDVFRRPQPGILLSHYCSECKFLPTFRQVPPNMSDFWQPLNLVVGILIKKVFVDGIFGRIQTYFLQYWSVPSECRSVGNYIPHTPFFY